MYYKYILICFLILILSSCTSIEKDKQSKSENIQIPKVKKTAIIAFDQGRIKEPLGNRKFIQKEVNFYNKGTGILEIDSASASCNCSSVKIIRGNVQAMSFGILQLNVNIDGFYDQSNSIKFTIYSNAKNSPTELFLELEK